MEKEFDLKIRTKRFAHRCVKLSMALKKNLIGKHLAGQLIRSATSVAANYRAAFIAQSRKSFNSKSVLFLRNAMKVIFGLSLSWTSN